MGGSARRGGGGSARCFNWARSSLTTCSRASALARHRSRERRRSRTSVSRSLSRFCNHWYFCFQRSRLFSNARARTRIGLRYAEASRAPSSVRAMVGSSLRNNAVLPSTTIAQQISPILQAQSELKMGNFHQPRGRLSRGAAAFVCADSFSVAVFLSNDALGVIPRSPAAYASPFGKPRPGLPSTSSLEKPFAQATPGVF